MTSAPFRIPTARSSALDARGGNSMLVTSTPRRGRRQPSRPYRSTGSAGLTSREICLGDNLPTLTPMWHGGRGPHRLGRDELRLHRFAFNVFACRRFRRRADRRLSGRAIAAARPCSDGRISSRRGERRHRRDACFSSACPRRGRPRPQASRCVRSRHHSPTRSYRIHMSGPDAADAAVVAGDPHASGWSPRGLPRSATRRALEARPPRLQLLRSQF